MTRVISGYYALLVVKNANITPLFVAIMFSSEIPKMLCGQVGGLLPLSTIHIVFKIKNLSNYVMAKYREQKLNVGTDKSFLKSKFSQDTRYY